MDTDVCLDQLVLSHQILDRGKIPSNLVSGQDALNLVKPEVKIFDNSNEVLCLFASSSASTSRWSSE